MRKVYPYLDNPYSNNINVQTAARTFLQKIDDFVNQKQYIRITLLDWQENGLKEIEGELTSGSITKDGASTIRRTCNFSCTVNGNEYDINDVDMDFSLNKKVFIEVGIKNYTDEYPEYPILWFPQGVFFIASFSISSSATTSVNISIQLKDKMAGLNGDVGGLFPATTILDTMDTQLPTGEYVTEKVLVYNIILEIVNHIGGELLQNIVIEDVPLRIQRVMRWMGENPLWIKPQGNIDEGFNYGVRVEPPGNTDGWEQYNNGDDVGYVFDDFYYTDDFTVAPGSTVTAALDAIVQYLGNYEYFYDEFGIFHFREIKNYLNTTQASIVSLAARKDAAGNLITPQTNAVQLEDYLVDVTTGKSIFNFTDNRNLINITVNPQYDNIKNDFIVQGLRKMTIDNISYPIRYHLAIDYKPRAGNEYKDLLLYKSPTDGLTKAMFPFHTDKLPEVGNFNIFYMLSDDYEKDGVVYKKWTDAEGDVVYFWSQDNEYIPIEPIEYYPDNDSKVGYITKDWRTEIYLRGLLARNNGTNASQYYTNLVNAKADENDTTAHPWIDDIFNTTKHEKIDIDFYYEELNAFWPEIYDLETQQFWAEKEDKSLQHTALTNGNWFLDFIDPSTTGLGEFCVSNIGRRTLVVNDDKINCLFEPVFPNINFINLDDDGEIVEEKRNECRRKGQPYVQVHSEIFYALSTGGFHFSCFDEIKYQLFLHTNYAKAISLIAIPAFYLEPNSRITVNDVSTNTYGDYMLTNITIPFGAGSTMSVAASECNMDRLQ